MGPALKRIVVQFYRSETGNEPAREWLKSLEPQDRRIVGADLQTLEYGWPLGMPLCRSIRSHKGLWEVRSNLTGGRIARLLFCIQRGRLIVLHGFIKKTHKTPDQELQIAAKRMKGEL